MIGCKVSGFSKSIGTEIGAGLFSSFADFMFCRFANSKAPLQNTLIISHLKKHLALTFLYSKKLSDLPSLSTCRNYGLCLMPS